jgi:hypothetical protein
MTEGGILLPSDPTPQGPHDMPFYLDGDGSMRPNRQLRIQSGGDRVGQDAGEGRRGIEQPKVARMLGLDHPSTEEVHNVIEDDFGIVRTAEIVALQVLPDARHVERWHRRSLRQGVERFIESTRYLPPQRFSGGALW